MLTRERFAALAEKYMDMVFRVAYGYMRSRDDADDGTMQDKLLTDFAGAGYITVFFASDQSGVPMYIQLEGFTAGEEISLLIGTNHLVG